MAIPESQLETWSHQGAVVTARATRESIYGALSDGSSLVGDKDFGVYLQGSYRNSTNIRGDSDVDIVAQLDSAFYRDISALPLRERQLYESQYSEATYTWSDFRSDVLQTLQSHYGRSIISEGNKAIKVGRGSGRLPADVVVCLQFRKYRHYRGLGDQEYIEGIRFYTLRHNRCITNFPKPHYENGVRKNTDTEGWFKRTVRVFKNARTHLVSQNAIQEELAPSYFVECLIYNVPNGHYGTNLRTTFLNVTNWIAERFLSDDYGSFVCQNGQEPLFGNTPEQWSELSAITFIRALLDLWQNWR